MHRSSHTSRLKKLRRDPASSNIYDKQSQHLAKESREREHSTHLLGKTDNWRVVSSPSSNWKQYEDSALTLLAGKRSSGQCRSVTVRNPPATLTYPFWLRGGKTIRSTDEWEDLSPAGSKCYLYLLFSQFTDNQPLRPWMVCKSSQQAHEHVTCFDSISNRFVLKVIKFCFALYSCCSFFSRLRMLS